MKTFGVILCISLMLFMNDARGGQGDLWAPPANSSCDYYVAAEDAKKSTWSNDKYLSTLEYRIKYLLEADRKAAKSPDIEEVQEVRGEVQDVLDTFYSEVVPHLQAKPNPILLSMMLYHHGKYNSDSVSESYWQAIKQLKKLDPRVTEHVDALLKKEKDAQKSKIEKSP